MGAWGVEEGQFAGRTASCVHGSPRGPHGVSLFMSARRSMWGSSLLTQVWGPAVGSIWPAPPQLPPSARTCLALLTQRRRLPRTRGLHGEVEGQGPGRPGSALGTWPTLMHLNPRTCPRGRLWLPDLCRRGRGSERESSLLNLHSRGVLTRAHLDSQGPCQDQGEWALRRWRILRAGLDSPFSQGSLKARRC